MELDIYKDYNFNFDLYKEFLDEKESKILYEALMKKVKWKMPITNNKRINQTYGNKGLIYKINFYNKGKYNTVERKTIPWEELSELIPIKEKIEKLIFDESSKNKFTICVIQLYMNGKIGINKHKDKEMKKGTKIVGLSLGEERILRMSNNKTEYDIKLPNGSLYVLNHPTNNYWTHEILKDDTIIKPRISLTFRDY